MNLTRDEIQTDAERVIDALDGLDGSTATVDAIVDRFPTAETNTTARVENSVTFAGVPASDSFDNPRKTYVPNGAAGPFVRLLAPPRLAVVFWTPGEGWCVEEYNRVDDSPALFFGDWTATLASPESRGEARRGSGWFREALDDWAHNADDVGEESFDRAGRNMKIAHNPTDTLDGVELTGESVDREVWSGWTGWFLRFDGQDSPPVAFDTLRELADKYQQKMREE